MFIISQQPVLLVKIYNILLKSSIISKVDLPTSNRKVRKHFKRFFLYSHFYTEKMVWLHTILVERTILLMYVLLSSNCLVIRVNQIFVFFFSSFQVPRYNYLVRRYMQIYGKNFHIHKLHSHIPAPIKIVDILSLF